MDSAGRNDAISSSGVVNQPSDLGDCAPDDEKLEMLRSLWNEHIANEWKKASEKVRLQFFRTLGYAAVANTPGLDLMTPAPPGEEAQSHSNPAKTSTTTRNDLRAAKMRKGRKPLWVKPLGADRLGIYVTASGKREPSFLFGSTRRIAISRWPKSS